MNIKDFSQPTILSGKQYGTTVRIELDHSDTSIDEVMDGMLTIVKGLGYLDTTINEWIKDKSKDIYEEECDIISKSLADDWFDESNESDEMDETDEDIENYFNTVAMDTNYGLTEDEEIVWDDERIDIIGQNGNEGTHYGLATDEDIEECELNEHSELNESEEDYEGQFRDWERETPTDEVEFNDYGMRIEKKKMDKSKVRRGKIKDLKK